MLSKRWTCYRINQKTLQVFLHFFWLRIFCFCCLNSSSERIPFSFKLLSFISSVYMSELFSLSSLVLILILAFKESSLLIVISASFIKCVLWNSASPSSTTLNQLTLGLTLFIPIYSNHLFHYFSFNFTTSLILSFSSYVTWYAISLPSAVISVGVPITSHKPQVKTSATPWNTALPALAPPL